MEVCAIQKAQLRLTRMTLTSGKGSSWLSDDDDGGRPSGVSVSNNVACSPGVCDGLGFLGEELKLLSELGVAGVRLKMVKKKEEIVLKHL